MTKPLLAILVSLPLFLTALLLSPFSVADSSYCQQMKEKGTYTSLCESESESSVYQPSQLSDLMRQAPVSTSINPLELEKRYQSRKAKRLREQRAAERFLACDSFGFKRGTDAHSECAMKLYMNEQNQMTPQSRPKVPGSTVLRNHQGSAVLRQQAIQQAMLKEQERVRRMEQSRKLIELGTGIATGSVGGSSASKMQSHTYTINGQIINCTTTGSSTDCY